MQGLNRDRGGDGWRGASGFFGFLYPALPEPNRTFSHVPYPFEDKMLLSKVCSYTCCGCEGKVWGTAELKRRQISWVISSLDAKGTSYVLTEYLTLMGSNL